VNWNKKTLTKKETLLTASLSTYLRFTRSGGLF
jgi:hypothetical protein